MLISPCTLMALGLIWCSGVQSDAQVLFTSGVPVATQHNDNLRTGAYLNESRITVASLQTRGMLRKYEIPVGRGVETQVLYVPNLALKPNLAVRLTYHNVAYVSTSGNQVLAFDVDTGTQLWSVSLTSSSNPGGIHSTPVIDVPNATMYVLYRTTNYCMNSPKCNQQPATVVFHMVALDIRTGATLRDQPIPAALSTVFGTIPFTPSAQYSRPGLLLNSYGLYVAFGAWVEDVDPYRGWLLKIDPSTLLVQSAFTPSPYEQGHSASGIWQSGGGIASDESGNIYLSTGNGPPDCYYASRPSDCSTPGRGAAPYYGGALLKLSPSLAYTGIFQPDGPRLPPDGSHNGIEWLNRDDLDFGSGGVVLLPGSATAHNVVSGGKPGRLYLTDDQLNPRQGFQAFFNMYLTNTSQLPSDQNYRNYPPYWDGNVYRLNDNPHLHGTPVYWRGPDPNFGYLYAWSEKDNLKAFKYYLNTKNFGPSFPPIGSNINPWAAHCPATNGDFLCNGLISPNETACSGDHSAIMPGGMLSLSANQSSAGTGVLWATLHTVDPGNQCQTRDKLLAYDAERLRLVWQDDFGWANNAPLNSSPKWGVPTVADGRLLVGTSNGDLSGKLLIYELPLNAPVAVRATGLSASAPIRVTWAIDDPGTDSFDVQVMGGVGSGPLASSLRSYAFSSLPGGLSSQIRVCSHMRGDLACSAWISPVNAQFSTWFDITKPELDQTGWGFADINSVPWAQAARAAYGFCTNNGFVGGRLNGYQALDASNIVSRVGVICDGTSASHFYDSTTGDRSGSPWYFAEVNTVGWAQASRLADQYCTAHSYRGGHFNGNEFNGLMGVVCYQGAWFDVLKTEVNLPSSDLNLETNWSEAARAANDACLRRQHNLGGRFNGWQSGTTFGTVCY